MAADFILAEKTDPPAPPPRVAVLQHVECEGLGTLEALLSPTLQLEILPAFAGARSYANAVDELLTTHAFEGLIALGGPMSVNDREQSGFLDGSLRLVRSALHRGAPVLGICLGAQLLAFALGAQVVPGRTLGLRKEIGWFPVHLTERGRVDPAFHGFRSGEPVFHWHGDAFTLPPGSWHLARSGLYPNQAFRWGRWAYGLQFHLEVTAAMISDWLEAYSVELASLDYVNREVLLEQTARRGPRLAELAAVAGRHWAECVLAFAREERAVAVERSASGRTGAGASPSLSSLASAGSSEVVS